MLMGESSPFEAYEQRVYMSCDTFKGFGSSCKHSNHTNGPDSQAYLGPRLPSLPHLLEEPISQKTSNKFRSVIPLTLCLILENQLIRANFPQFGENNNDVKCSVLYNL